MHAAFEGMREPHFREDFFKAWKIGATGYPLVVASMRSLQANGWINFRMRAMLVSFASYHLWLDWRVAALHLAKLFTDYEPGIHFSQLQIQSGVTGMNAIRVYNPIKQSIDHDPNGKFIRRYVPELNDVSDQWIHEPWCNPSQTHSYPSPIVDHEAAIKFARAELSMRRQSDGFRDRSRADNQKLGSRNKQPKRRIKDAKATGSLDLICRVSRNCSINKMRRRRFNSDSGTGRFLRCRLLFGRQGDVRQRCVLTRNPQVRGEVVLVCPYLQMAFELLLQ